MPKRSSALERDSDAYRMLSYLKEVIHARGLRYREVAAALEVSEKSIKRYMTGRGLSLALLERLCGVVGLNLRELADLAGVNDEARPVWTTDAQEEALVADHRLAIVLELLANGWSAARIVREGLAGESHLNAILIRLDRLGVITLYPGNRIRIRARVRPLDACSDRMREVISNAGLRVIQGLDLTKPDALWRLYYARLGAASIARASGRLSALLREIAELSRQDMDLTSDQVKWYAVCGLITEHEVRGLKLLQDAEEARAQLGQISAPL